MPERDMQEIVKDFSVLYPGVHVTFFRSDTMDLMTRLDTEFLAERPMADIVWLSDDSVMKRLEKDDRLSPLPEIDTTAFSKNTFDAAHHFFGTIYQGTGILCHGSVARPIQSFKELLTPTLKDSLVMPSPLFSGAAAFNLSVLSEHPSFGWSFWEELMKNHPLLVKGNGAVVETVSKQGRLYGIILDVLALNAIKHGAGLIFSYCDDGVPVIREPIALLKSSDHKMAGIQFITYILSKRGQEKLASLGYRPLHRDVPTPKHYEQAYFKGKTLGELKEPHAQDQILRDIPSPIDINAESILSRFEVDRLKFSQFLKT